MTFHSFLLEDQNFVKRHNLKLSIEDILPYITYDDNNFTLKCKMHNDYTCTQCKKTSNNIDRYTYLDYIRKLEIEPNANVRRHHINDVKRLFNIDMSQWSNDKLVYDEEIVENILQKGISFNVINFNDIMSSYKIQIVGKYASLYDYILNNKIQQILNFSKNFIINDNTFKNLNNIIFLFKNIVNYCREYKIILIGKKDIDNDKHGNGEYNSEEYDSEEYDNEECYNKEICNNHNFACNLDIIHNIAQLSTFKDLLVIAYSANDSSIINAFNAEYNENDYHNIITIKRKYTNIKISELISKSPSELKNIINIKFNTLQDYRGLLNFEYIFPCCLCNKYMGCTNICKQEMELRNYDAQCKARDRKYYRQRITSCHDKHKNQHNINEVSMRHYMHDVFEFDYKMNRLDVYNSVDACTKFEELLEKKYYQVYKTLIQLSIERNINSTNLTKNYTYDSTNLFFKSTSTSKYCYEQLLGEMSIIRLEINKQNLHSHIQSHSTEIYNIKKKHIDEMLKFPFNFDYRIKIYGDTYTSIPTKHEKKLLPLFEQKLLNSDVFYDNLDELFGDNIKCTNEMISNINEYYTNLTKLIIQFDPEYKCNMYYNNNYQVDSIVKLYNIYLDMKMLNDRAREQLSHPVFFGEIICKIEESKLFDDIIIPIRKQYDELKNNFMNSINKESTQVIQKYCYDNAILHNGLSTNYIAICDKIMALIPKCKIPDLYIICHLDNNIIQSNVAIIMKVLDIYLYVSKYMPSTNISQNSFILENNFDYIIKHNSQNYNKYNVNCVHNQYGTCINCFNKLCSVVVDKFDKFLTHIKMEHKKLCSEMRIKLKNYDFMKNDIIDKLELVELEQIYQTLNNFFEKTNM